MESGLGSAESHPLTSLACSQHREADAVKTRSAPWLTPALLALVSHAYFRDLLHKERLFTLLTEAAITAGAELQAVTGFSDPERMTGMVSPTQGGQIVTAKGKQLHRYMEQ